MRGPPRSCPCPPPSSCNAAPDAAPRPTLRVHEPAFYRALVANGSVGAGESFMAGEWDCDDLVGLVRLLVRNRELLEIRFVKADLAVFRI